MNGKTSNDTEYRVKDIKPTLELVPHVVIVKPEDDNLGRKVLKYGTIRGYDRPQKFEPVTFTDGVYLKKIRSKGFIIQVISGRIQINYDSDENATGLLNTGLELMAGDIYGVTDAEIGVIGIKELEESEVLISIIR